jgi:hypothetical protein
VHTVVGHRVAFGRRSCDRRFMLRGVLVASWCVLWLVAGAMTTACTSGECGAGTVRFGSTCVAVDPFDRTPPTVHVDPPLYTRQVGIVRLTTDEPATIYYTIDGSTPSLDGPSEPDHVVLTNVPDDANIRFFAIDLNGNRSAEESRGWIIDREGPASPLDFTLAVQGTTRTVSWTTPPEPRLAGVVVARVEGTLTAAPIAGERYTDGVELAPGVTIVHVASDEPGPGTFTETRVVKPGIVRYVAWTFDQALNYGPPAGAFELVAVPAQSAFITVTAATGNVALLTAPSHVTITGVATLAASRLTVELSLRNDTSRVLFAPKLRIVNTLAAGVTWSNSQGDLDGKPFRALGAAWRPDEMLKATLVFDGTSSATDLILHVELHDNPVLATSYQNDSARGGPLVDARTGTHIRELEPSLSGQNRQGAFTHGGITPDGLLIAGARSQGSVMQFDLVTGVRKRTVRLRTEKGHVPQLVLDRSGSAAYAIIAENHLKAALNGSGASSELVRFDAATLTEVGRLPLGVSRNRDMQLSPDGKTLLISTSLPGEGVIVVDLTTFKIRARLITSFRPQAVAFSPDGAQFALVGETITTYSLASLAEAATYPTPPTVNGGKVVRAAYRDAQTLWVGRRDEIAIVDLRDGGSSILARSGKAIEMTASGVFVTAGSNVQELDTAGTEVRTLPGFANRAKGHWIGRSPF